jgi:endoglucanase
MRKGHILLFAVVSLFMLALFGQENSINFRTEHQSDSMVSEYPFAAEQISADPDSISPDTTDMRGITSVELAREMIPGWNVGNSLEALNWSTHLPDETAWGNPLITQDLIDAIKAAGFNAVRIPVAWSNFSDELAFTIEESWLERVEEVVCYVLDNGMYAIINEHWDNGWIQPTSADSEYVSERLAAMWQQIAIFFRDYDDHLLFAGTNEVMVEGNYGTPTREYYTVQNSYNQTFVNTVRATGGRNYYRHLVVQGFNTNIGYTLSYFTIPTDVVPNRLMVEVHYYDPYNFTMNESSNIIQWGKYATDPSKTETWANESYADNKFNQMKTNFIDNGYAVILGEYGAISRLDLESDELNAEHAEYRRYYINYITCSMVRCGLVPFYWDNGYTGNHGFGIFDRSTSAQVYPDLVSAIVDGADSSIVSIEIEGDIEKPDASSLNRNYPNPFNPTTQISYSLAEPGKISLDVYDLKGQKVTVLINNEYTEPGNYRLFFDASELPSGIYLYRLIGDAGIRTRKMVLLK